VTIEPHLEVGESASFAKTIAECDLMLFAGLSGDFDPVHVNEAYAKTTVFGRRIAHGALVMSLCSTTASQMASRSRERGADAAPFSLGYDKIRFLKPVFIGDTLTARYTVEAVDRERGRTRARIEVLNQAGETCLAGTHVMKWVARS